MKHLAVALIVICLIVADFGSDLWMNDTKDNHTWATVDTIGLGPLHDLTVLTAMGPMTQVAPSLRENKSGCNLLFFGCQVSGCGVLLSARSVPGSLGKLKPSVMSVACINRPDTM